MNGLDLDAALELLRHGTIEVEGRLVRRTYLEADVAGELTEIAEGIGRPIRQRTPTYGVPAARG